MIKLDYRQRNFLKCLLKWLNTRSISAEIDAEYYSVNLNDVCKEIERIIQSDGYFKGNLYIGFFNDLRTYKSFTLTEAELNRKLDFEIVFVKDGIFSVYPKIN